MSLSFVNAARRGLAALGLVALVAGTTGIRSATADAVDDIVSKKKLQVGVLVDLPPFGMNSATNEPEGYDVDVARLMAKYLGVQLEIVPVTGPNRIPYLLTNKVDVLIATFGITPERAKQVNFSIPYSAIDVVLAAPKAKAITTAKDLKGLKVGVTRASTQDTALAAIAPEGTQIMRFEDEATTTQALLSGQIDAIGVTTLLLKPIQELNPSADYEAKFVLRRQPNGVAMRRGQPELLQWVNTFVYFIKNNGELNALHQKWLDKPLGDLPVF